MTSNRTWPGKTVIYYRIDELFNVSKSFAASRTTALLNLFARTLPLPLGDTSIVLLQSGGRFDVTTWFGGPIFTHNVIDPILLLERFVAPFGKPLKFGPYNAYVISLPERDFIVSYEPERGEFLFSTSMGFVGMDTYAYMCESSLFDGVVFSQVFPRYVDLLREFIDFVYDAYAVDVKQIIGLEVPHVDVLSNLEVIGSHSKKSDTAKTDSPCCDVLPFVRPPK